MINAVDMVSFCCNGYFWEALLSCVAVRLDIQVSDNENEICLGAEDNRWW